MAKAAENSLVLSIDKKTYERIKVETAKTEAEQKLEFMMRYIPRLRVAPRGLLEELDIMFVRESFGKGFRILKDGEHNDSVYFVLVGTCKVLQPLNRGLGSVKALLSPEEQSRYKYLALRSFGTVP